MNQQILKDDAAVKYLLRHDEMILEHFDVPNGESPGKHILRLSNENIDSKSAVDKLCYKIQTLYVTKIVNCSICKCFLKLKNHHRMDLYDDVFGTITITVLTKYCTQCKVTYYPGFIDNYKDKQKLFDENFAGYGVFFATKQSAFSIDLLDRLICMKQKCHVTFIGKSQAYNLHHTYTVHDNRKLDKRRLSDGYYKYTLVLFKKRYSIPMVINGSIDEALRNDFLELYTKFQSKYGEHECDVNGCKQCVVIDGNMKAHRKICKKNGCVQDPAFKSIFCKTHTSFEPRPLKEGTQVIIEEEECHVEKILKKVLRKGRSFYEISWKNSSITTLEPKENVPRVLIELFERFGDSSISTEIVKEFELHGTKYVNLSVNDEIICLPACSMEVNDQAYLIKPFEESCNTVKTKSRFYQRTGGILVMARPCGIIISMNESVCQVSEVIEFYLQNNKCAANTKCMIYDDACHVRRHVDSKSRVYPKLKELDMRIDRFHFQNHTDPWCRQNMDPAKSPFMKNVNSEVMEQIFAWVKGFVPALRYMNSFNFNFFMLDMIDRFNIEKIGT